jgi:hypothetical protein
VKTDDLVSLLATDIDPVPRGVLVRNALLAVGFGLPVAIAVTLGTVGLRPGIAGDFPVPMFWAKELFCAWLSIFGFLVLIRMARPGARPGLAPVAIIGAIAMVWLMGAVAVFSAQAQERASLIFGQTALVCPFLIASISVPLFVAFVWLLRSMAPTRLRLAGAAAGFASGAAGALVYTLHCPEMAAPFLGIWYVLGMLIPTAVGAALGPALLRW